MAGENAVRLEAYSANTANPAAAKPLARTVVDACLLTVILLASAIAMASLAIFAPLAIAFSAIRAGLSRSKSSGGWRHAKPA